MLQGLIVFDVSFEISSISNRLVVASNLEAMGEGLKPRRNGL